MVLMVICAVSLLCVEAEQKPSAKGSGAVSPLTAGLLKGLAALKQVLAMVWNAVKMVLGALNPCLPNGVINCDQSIKEFAGPPCPAPPFRLHPSFWDPFSSCCAQKNERNTDTSKFPRQGAESVVGSTF